MTPNKYRSLFTGKEIDELLSQVKTKLDSSVIKNDFTGGTEYVASAEVAKTLKTRVDALSDPNYFKTLLLSVEDNNIYSNAEKAKVSSLAMTAKFVGSFQDAADRNAAVLPTLTGNEVAFLADDGSGQGTAAISRFNSVGGVWENARVTGTNVVKKSGTLLSGDTFVAAEFNTNFYTGAKVTVSVRSANRAILQIKEILFGRSLGTNHIFTIGDIGTSSTFFTVATVISGALCQLVVTLNGTGIVSAERHSLV